VEVVPTEVIRPGPVCEDQRLLHPGEGFAVIAVRWDLNGEQKRRLNEGRADGVETFGPRNDEVAFVAGLLVSDDQLVEQVVADDRAERVADQNDLIIERGIGGIFLLS
jgi:hypothetical protein